MKNYEEKYNQTIESIKRIYEQADSFGKELMEKEFPELRESEDERIRKWCISHFRECINVIKDNDEYKEYLSNKVIACLEKQKKYDDDNIKLVKKETSEKFAKVIRGNLTSIDNCLHEKIKQIYQEVTGDKMYGGYTD